MLMHLPPALACLPRIWWLKKFLEIGCIGLLSIWFQYSYIDYYLTAVQYALFTLLAVYGFWVWQQEYKRQKLC